MPPARNFAKPKNTKQVLSRILEYIGRSKSLLFVVFVMLILSTLCTTGASYWLKPILNDVESTIKANTFATEGIKLLLEVVVVTVVEESQGASAAGGVVDDFRHDGVVLTEVEFVADADFPCRFHEHVPQPQFGIQFPEEEYFDVGSRLFLVDVESGGKDFGVVEDEDVLVVEVFEQVDEVAVLYRAVLAVQHQQSAFVAVGGRIFCDMVLG